MEAKQPVCGPSFYFAVTFEARMQYDFSFFLIQMFTFVSIATSVYLSPAIASFIDKS